MHLCIIFYAAINDTSMYVVPLEVMSSASISAIYIMFIEHHIASPKKVFHMCLHKTVNIFQQPCSKLLNARQLLWSVDILYLKM